MTAREFVLVAVHDDGATGWGECVADADPFYSAESTATAWHVLTKYLVPMVLGQPVGRAADLAASVAARARPSHGQGGARDGRLGSRSAPPRRAALRTCSARRARPIAAGVSIGIQPSIEALAERVAAELADGYRRIKIKIKPGWDRDPVSALRARFGDIPLMVDANAAYTADAAPTPGGARRLSADDDRAAARLR